MDPQAGAVGARAGVRGVLGDLVAVIRHQKGKRLIARDQNQDAQYHVLGRRFDQDAGGERLAAAGSP